MNGPLTSEFLLRQFGAAVDAKRAAVFVGAGLSIPAGAPSWDELLEPLRAEAQVPASTCDPALDAEYIVLELGEVRVRAHLLAKLIEKKLEATSAIRTLMKLEVDEYWTTNYDTLLEGGTKEYVERIVADTDYRSIRSPYARRLTKMHGSISLPSEPSPSWESPPVLTRSDFESYERSHPSMAALLRATFLTRSILFLGLSFRDPNVELLLRMSRSLPLSSGRPTHFAVLRRPPDPADRREFELKVKDLSSSGVYVFEIDTYEEQDLLLTKLEVRTRPPNLFISGGDSDGENPSAQQFGSEFALGGTGSLVSMGSKAGAAAALGHRSRLLEHQYDPDQYRFYFRKLDGPPPEMKHRIGTAVYTNLDVEELREHLIGKSRALIAFGGGPRTKQEMEIARGSQVPVVPFASADGAAREFWSGETAQGLGHTGPDADMYWERLGSDNQVQAVDAAVRLARRAMAID